ncbi:MAG TPA: inositol monophosphatase family protein, partial [Terriglobales bacterium]|nr:inositol monophosphatase family protein [Terriglobales bacterium]
QMNERSIQVSKTSELGESIVATGFPSQKRHKNPNIHFYHQITMKTHGIRRAGSAALDLAYVACGRFDGYWEFNLNSWDTAAGVLLVQEAGGLVTDFWGGPFDIASREVLAGNPAIHPALMREMQNVMEGKGIEALPSATEYGRTRSF